jgi:UDP-N-acetylmuramoyl-L-alanyl-D-glutamate--2,6-diaminopimelate ligase
MYRQMITPKQRVFIFEDKLMSNEVEPKARSISSVLAMFDIVIPEIEIENIVLDSRDVNQASLFIAHKGTQESGRKYVLDAIDNGAKLALIDTDNPKQHGEVKETNAALIISFFDLESNIGSICNEFYRNVSSKLQCIATTGTNGKTSVAHICAQLSAICHEDAATIGTMGVGFYTKDKPTEKVADTINTTPDIASLNKFANLVKQRGAKRLCIEASSHGLEQNRLSDFHIDVAAFTNLTQDHLDYHHSLENYAGAKRLLLKQEGLKYLVLNADDQESHYWAQEAAKDMMICLCSVKEQAAEQLVKAYSQRHHHHHYKYCIALNARFTPSGSTFEIDSSWGQASVSLPLIGQFNIANLLTALGALLMQGLSFDLLLEATEKVNGVPGRMEVFESREHGNIIVDYAHTPDALQQALLAARQHAIGKLVVIFGCGGDRDNSKRGHMGSTAERLADEVILTQDNSRNESLETIIADICQGIRNKSKLKIQLTRTTAIKEAYVNSQSDDLILVAGKGHEEYLELNSVREYYNEREYVKQLTMEFRG